MSRTFIHIQKQEMFDTFLRVLLQKGFSRSKAETCAEVFTTNSLEGIYTHGVNRFPRFISYIDKGYVKIDQEPSRVGGFGALEQWDGNLGPGPLNALAATDRAMHVAAASGIGCVALANTNHWMRGGYYRWHAARKGFIFIGWTNTMGNMPAWGAIDSKLGNNPLVIALQYGDEGIVLDMAMSQYSYGALDLYVKKGEKLPVTGGYDTHGNLTDDPQKIMDSQRVMPIGYWKGAGLSLLLDLLATILSGGLSTAEISKRPAEHSLSQVFIAIDIRKLHNHPSVESAIQAILDDYHQSNTDTPGKKVRYPSENIQQTREANLKNGIPIVKTVWEEILSL